MLEIIHSGTLAPLARRTVVSHLAPDQSLRVAHASIEPGAIADLIDGADALIADDP